MKNDPVNSPSHYASGQIEVIEAIEDWKMNYHRGNAIKYVARAGRKDPQKTVEDLKKAIWYLNREIYRIESEMLGRPMPKPTETNIQGYQPRQGEQ